jgi:hypothetical protein
MSEEPLVLDYSYPEFGLVSVPFYEESKQIVQFLAQVESDGLRHYERLDHLGRIRDAHKSAHHSRWEYMLLQMYLVHELKEAKSSFGLGGGIRLNHDCPINA